jgi:hypothetical protein
MVLQLKQTGAVHGATIGTNGCSAWCYNWNKRVQCIVLQLEHERTANVSFNKNGRHTDTMKHVLNQKLLII